MPRENHTIDDDWIISDHLGSLCDIFTLTCGAGPMCALGQKHMCGAKAVVRSGLANINGIMTVQGAARQRVVKLPGAILAMPPARCVGRHNEMRRLREEP